MMRVILYGSSLLIWGMSESMKALPGIEWVRVAADRDELLEQVHRFQPQAVVAEAGALPDGLSMDLMRTVPELALVTLDLECNRARVLSGHQAQAITTKDVVHMIETKIAVDSEQEVELSGKMQIGDETTALSKPTDYGWVARRPVGKTLQTYPTR